MPQAPSSETTSFDFVRTNLSTQKKTRRGRPRKKCTGGKSRDHSGCLRSQQNSSHRLQGKTASGRKGPTTVILDLEKSWGATDKEPAQALCAKETYKIFGGWSCKNIRRCKIYDTELLGVARKNHWWECKILVRAKAFWADKSEVKSGYFIKDEGAVKRQKHRADKDR